MRLAKYTIYAKGLAVGHKRWTQCVLVKVISRMTILLVVVYMIVIVRTVGTIYKTNRDSSCQTPGYPKIDRI